jgi:hypothetical protein
MLPRPRRLAGPLALAGALGALFSAGAARAQVTVAPTVTSTGALFNYSYTVTNFSADDLFTLNINGLPQVPGALTNLTAPAGFQIAFDPGNANSPSGIVTFLGDFMPGSVNSGFSFSSTFGPGTVAFDAEGSNLNSATPANDTFMGTTLAPVPEASTVVSLGAGVLLLTFCAVRRRRTARADVRS